ncbi:hypothetical protein [Sulfurospirillum oryzae]|uniref:hypothetical protein n=1 Tax=Sulfurospirillum oryzae TaxID=2976535 RepID=UPI0021E72705|nr:hypothetical protein [Sulfurospirillum oryzae]
MNRRESIITLGLLSASVPLALYADDNKAIIIESDSNELKFKVGKDAFILRPHSKIELSHDGTFTKALKLIGGGVMGVFGGGEKTIETKTFTAGIRGTGIYLQEYAPDAVYSCLCYGVGEYKNPTTNEVLFSLNSTYHDKPVQIVKTSMEKIEYQGSKLVNHNDDELRHLEHLCQREAPFEAYLKAEKVKRHY